MHKFMKTRIALVAAWLAWPVLANAQTTPDIQDSITRGSQIDDIIKDQQDRSDAALLQEEGIDGEAGVYVLRRNEIFFVGGGASAGYSSNPLRTADDVGGSFSASLAFSTGIQTKVAEKFDVGLTLNASGVDYDKSFGPSSRSLHSALSVGSQIGGTPLYASITGFGGWNFDQDFDRGTSFYGASAALSAGFPLGRKTVVRPGLGVTRQWSQSSENNSISAAASLDIVHAISPRLTIAAGANISRIWFDNFFEDVTFVARNDWQYAGGLSLSYRLSDNASLGLSSAYEKRSSTFFLSAYESYDASASLSLRVRF
jgi:hypothetical protein